MKTLKIMTLVILCAVAGGAGLNHWLIGQVRSVVYERQMLFTDDSKGDVVNQQKAPQTKDDSFAVLDKVQPFKKVELLDDDAKTWSDMFVQYGGAGVLTFDANGDDKQDIYIVHSGQNWLQATDEYGILSDKKLIQHNVLYLNQGNNAQGEPVFKKVQDLVRQNETYVKEELLIEDLLFPRADPDTYPQKGGRRGNYAAAADLNNDGLMDVIIANEPEGMFWSHPKTQRVLMQFINPVGREAKQSKQPLEAMSIHLKPGYVPENGENNTRLSLRGSEPEGANSFYLNMGDKDGDGLPEWQDMSQTAGLQGVAASHGLSVADIDLDGDLDVFVGNTMDMDYWVGGSKYWAGGANALYINELAQTGTLRFTNKAAEMNVDGVYDEDNPMPDYYRLRKIPFLPAEYSFMFMQFEPYQPEFLEINGEEGGRGQITWSTVLQDVNHDGYVDVWSANDMGFLRLYMNEQGKRFKLTEHARSQRSGYWMTFACGDFNGDLEEDIFAGNLGGAVMNHAFVTPDPRDLFDPVLLNSTIFSQFFNDKHDTRHGMIDGRDFRQEIDNQVYPSQVLPPDVTLPHNYRRHAPKDVTLPEFDPNAINAYEFAWGSATLDIQNDGLWDMYYTGGLYGRGGGLFPISGTSPGRMMVNATQDPDQLRFEDLTAEHHMFNIEQLRYDRLASQGYLYRESPRQNWGKRDTLYSYDRSNWILQGPGVQEKVSNQDMIQAAEAGRAVVASDLNGDGYSDIIVRNKGGYDSRSSTATNLKVRQDDGTVRVVPAHNNNYPSPTNFEAGKTWVYLNNYTANHWIKVKLVDDTPGSFNRNAVGAKVIINNRVAQFLRSGTGGFQSNKFEALLFGLGQQEAVEVEVIWPDKQQTRSQLQLNHLKNTSILISKSHGLVKEPS